MISKATVHKATVLMNRRMNAERGPAAAGFGSVCSSVAGIVVHHLEGSRGVQEGSATSASNIVISIPPLPLPKGERIEVRGHI
jgi:hypothetical protein